MFLNKLEKKELLRIQGVKTKNVLTFVKYNK